MGLSAALHSAQIWTTAMGGLTLAIGVVEDFRARKFTNRSFLIMSIAGFAVSVATLGLNGLQQSALGFASGFALLLPLVLLGGIGAGDMKLLAAFGAACGWTAAFEAALFGLVWGAVFGVIHAILKGQALQLVRNTARMAAARSSTGLTLNKIPYAGALFLGWLAHLAYRGAA